MLTCARPRFPKRLCAVGLCWSRWLQVIREGEALPRRAQSSRFRATLSWPSFGMRGVSGSGSPAASAARTRAHCSTVLAICRLFVTGGGAIGTIARHRACAVSSSTAPALILEVRHRADGALVHIKHASGEMPQSLQIDLSTPRECELMVDFIKSNEPSRIEFLDPTNTPFALVDLLIGLNVPYDLFIADAGLLGQARRAIFADRSPRSGHKSCKPLNASLGVAGEIAKWPDRWRRIAQNAQQIVVPDVQAEAFAKVFCPEA